MLIQSQKICHRALYNLLRIVTNFFRRCLCLQVSFQTLNRSQVSAALKIAILYPPLLDMPAILSFFLLVGLTRRLTFSRASPIRRTSFNQGYLHASPNDTRQNMTHDSRNLFKNSGLLYPAFLGQLASDEDLNSAMYSSFTFNQDFAELAEQDAPTGYYTQYSAEIKTLMSAAAAGTLTVYQLEKWQPVATALAQCYAEEEGAIFYDSLYFQDWRFCGFADLENTFVGNSKPFRVCGPLQAFGLSPISRPAVKGLDYLQSPSDLLTAQALPSLRPAQTPKPLKGFKNPVTPSALTSGLGYYKSSSKNRMVSLKKDHTESGIRQVGECTTSSSEGYTYVNVNLLGEADCTSFPSYCKSEFKQLLTFLKQKPSVMRGLIN